MMTDALRAQLVEFCNSNELTHGDTYPVTFEILSASVAPNNNGSFTIRVDCNTAEQKLFLSDEIFTVTLDQYRRLAASEGIMDWTLLAAMFNSGGCSITIPFEYRVAGETWTNEEKGETGVINDTHMSLNILQSVLDFSPAAVARRDSIMDKVLVASITDTKKNNEATAYESQKAAMMKKMAKIGAGKKTIEVQGKVVEEESDPKTLKAGDKKDSK